MLKLKNKLYGFGKGFFGEPRITYEGREYRFFDPLRSKLAAALRLSEVPLPGGSDIVIYLGASAGYTVSFVSDLVAGVFAVEISARMVRDLVFLSEQKGNIAPIFDDANHPENYKEFVLPADWMFQDVAQRNQVGIALKNLCFLKKDGVFLLVIKARSIDFRKPPSEVFDSVRFVLENSARIVQEVSLENFYKGHHLFILKRL